MDSLVGLAVIIYLIASVAGAVIERMRRGPLYEDLPTMTPGEGGRQPVEPERPMEAADADGTSQLPEPIQVEPVTAESAEPRSTVFQNTREAASAMPEKSEIREPQAALSRTAASTQESSPVHPLQPSQRPFRSGWRRAVVMMEIMDKPRGLNPYLPPRLR